MGITYRVDESQGVVFECWSGPIVAADVAALWKERLADPACRNCLKTLADVQACRPRFSGLEYQHLVQTWLVPNLKDRRRLRIAVLVRDPLQFGIARQFQIFFEPVGDSEVFTTMDAALQWLHT